MVTARGEGVRVADVPEAAELITGLVNSRKHAYAADRLDSPEEAADVVRSLLLEAGADEVPEAEPVDADLVARLRTLREDLVAALTADSPAEREQAWAGFTANSRHVTVWHDFTCGEVRLRSGTGSGAETAVVLAAATLVADGRWVRVKMCANDLCGAAFYDTTRSRTQRWHSYEVCGNRHNVAAHRARHGGS
jgi:predicted RNA-binding Zn ribbon-like protein